MLLRWPSHTTAIMEPTRHQRGAPAKTGTANAGHKNPIARDDAMRRVSNRDKVIPARYANVKTNRGTNGSNPAYQRLKATSTPTTTASCQTRCTGPSGNGLPAHHGDKRNQSA